MKDLNQHRGHSSCSGWDNIEYWMSSVNFWSGRLSEFGDIRGYKESLEGAVSMVELELFGVQ
jgi:hypothetical protein